MRSRDGRCESEALAGRSFPDLGHSLERPFLFTWMSRLEDRLRPSERAHQERSTVGVGQSEGRERRASMQRMVLCTSRVVQPDIPRVERSPREGPCGIPMRIKVFQCVCGFAVRAILSQGCAVFRPDPEAWQKRCVYRNRIQVPKGCPRFLEATNPYAKRARETRRPRP